MCEQAGFIRDNRLPHTKQAMVSDAIGTVAGAALGTSTVTSFIESAVGVEQGGRTGLTGLVVAALFLLALFFSPLIAMVIELQSAQREKKIFAAKSRILFEPVRPCR